MQRTITVIGSIESGFRSLEKYENTYLCVEKSNFNFSKTKIGMFSGKGWEYINLSEKQVYDLIVSLEDTLHDIPLAEEWIY